MQDHNEPQGIRIQSSEPTVPQDVYINLQPRFASLPITIPHLRVNLPENPTLQPQPNMVVIKLKNNGRLKLNQFDPKLLDGRDWNQQTEIESMEWQGQTYSGTDLLAKRQQLLEQYFETMLGGKEAVAQLRRANEASGLVEGSYLYRAVDQFELQRIERESYKEVSYLDPSANFENEEMYNDSKSQVKHYAAQTEQYSGKIIRWKIEHPLLYRRAGLNPPRVQPMFSHYLPQTIEISNDGGKTFSPLPLPK
jgi:hypothetical protein